MDKEITIEDDALHFFDKNKIIIRSGMNAGEYLDKEDFERFAASIKQIECCGAWDVEIKKDFNKAINALALELPEAVWNDFHFRWMKLQNSISPCKVDELRKSFEVDKETMQAAINRASNIMDEQSKRISELEEELNKLSKPVTKMP
jgi:hypothetical protein